MKKKYRKITSALLCILAITMIVLAFPIQAFADEPNESTGPSVLEPTAVIPNPDYDPDADEGSLGTPSIAKTDVLWETQMIILKKILPCVTLVKPLLKTTNLLYTNMNKLQN